MKLSIGIVGLPNVGKSTLFKVLTKNEVNIANYPFCTIDPNIGIVTIPDERLDKLARMSKSKKVVPAVIEFYDIAGLVKGAYKGEGLGNQFLSHIRDTNAIVMVLRVFKNDDIIHVENSVDPIRDMEIINSELAMKDLDTIEKVLKKPPSVKYLEDLKKAKTLLEQNKPTYGLLQDLNLLTAKKQLYFLNGVPADVSEALKKRIAERGANFVIADLSSISDIPELAKKAYEVLNLISFLTTGEAESRAWTIEKGSKAPQAAGVIHTDFEKKFIRAEVVNWQKLLEAGSWSAAKQKGWLRLEGKEYVVADGDVMEIRHG